MINELITAGKTRGYDIEVYNVLDNTLEISTLNDELTNFNISNNNNYAIKAIRNGKCIKLYTGVIDIDNILNSLDEIYLYQENDTENEFSTNDFLGREDINESIDIPKIKEDLLSLNNLRSKYKELVSIETTFCRESRKYEIINGKHTMQESKQLFDFETAITVKNASQTKIAYISSPTTDYDFSAFLSLVEERVVLLIKKLESKSLKTDRYKIVLRNNVVNSIMKAMQNMFFAKSIYLKESILQDSFDKNVFSKLINIVEDPKNKNYIGYRSFDDEGTLTTYKDIVKDGKFILKLNNIEYSKKLGENPTGNSYGIRNMYIKPGKKTFDELLLKMHDGIIIDEVYGTHAGINQKTGTISLQAEGFTVKNGKIDKPLNMIILSTDIKELLNNVIEIGNDLKFFDEQMGMPSLLIDNITVAGRSDSDE